MASIRQFASDAFASGTINDIFTPLTIPAVHFQLVDGLSATLTSSAESWANGPLTLKLRIENTGGEFDYEDVAVSTILNPEILTLTEGAVTINGASTENYTFDPETGSFSIVEGASLTVAADSSAEISFVVERVG